MKKSRRKIIYGNDIFQEIEHPDLEKSYEVSYWNLWIALLLVNSFDGDWEGMIEYVRLRLKTHLYLRSNYEGLSNHIRMLHQTLADLPLTPADLFEGADIDTLKRQLVKAKKKILEMSFKSKERSQWMIDTPPKRWRERAMHGHWDRFPVNPEKFAAPLRRIYKKTRFYRKGETFALEEKLSNYIDKQERKASTPALFALYRAFMTVATQKMDNVDDSYGVIGGMFEEVFQKYYSLDRENLAMAPEDFLQDLMELMIWEDYGGTYKKEEECFGSLSSTEIPIAESILRKQREELREIELNYGAEKALTYLGMLYTENKLFDRFESTAALMGTRHWKRITSMSEMAERHGRNKLALAVYEACLEPGHHESYLREKCDELKKRIRSKKEI